MITTALAILGKEMYAEQSSPEVRSGGLGAVCVSVMVVY